MLHTAKADIRGTQEWRLRVGIDEHVAGLVPCATQDVMLSRLRLRPGPLFHVAGHVVSAPRSHALLAADRNDAGTAEVAGGNDVGGPNRSGGAVPVVDSRQALAGKFGVSRGLIPADAGH